MGPPPGGRGRPLTNDRGEPEGAIDRIAAGHGQESPGDRGRPETIKEQCRQERSRRAPDPRNTRQARPTATRPRHRGAFAAGSARDGEAGSGMSPRRRARRPARRGSVSDRHRRALYNLGQVSMPDRSAMIFRLPATAGSASRPTSAGGFPKRMGSVLQVASNTERSFVLSKIICSRDRPVRS